MPKSFSGHPFRFLDHKEQAAIKKRAVTRTALRKAGKGRRFYMDFGFLRSSSSDFQRPSTDTDRVVTSFDGFKLYLLIVDEHMRYVCVFLTRSKDPPVETAGAFLTKYGLIDGGMIRCNQGDELARSEDFRTRMMRDHGYVVEPTGADDPAQNGGAES